MSQLAAKYDALDRDLKTLWIAVFCLMFGFGIYAASFFNFVTETVKIQPTAMGLLESVRETPGFLCVFVAAITMRMVEPLLGTISLMLMAVGMGAYAWVGGIHSVILWSFVWSVGFHTWMPVQSSLVLSLAGDGAKGKRLGQSACVGSVGALLGMSAVMLVGHGISYSNWFLTGGSTIGLAALVLIRLRRDIGHVDKPRLVMKRRYSLYYSLTFLEGCRKQVFFTFAVYALTRVYHTQLRTIALLMVINNLVNMFGAPYVGKLIDRIGERKILTTSYTALILVFLGYATIRHASALYVLYCLDNLFYLSTTCLTTYLHKISAPEDLMPTLSMGVTFNHAAAVLVPAIGGLLWAKLGYSVTFFGGAVVVAISLILARRVGGAKDVGLRS